MFDPRVSAMFVVAPIACREFDAGLEHIVTFLLRLVKVWMTYEISYSFHLKEHLGHNKT